MRTTRVNKKEGIRKILSGIDVRLASFKSVTLAGKDYAPADLKLLFQGLLDVLDATDSAKEAAHQAHLAEVKRAAEISPIQRALRAFVIAMFGDDSGVLVDFGFTPRKKAVTSPETKAQGLAKRRATRAARHIMGRRQRLKIVAPATPPEAPGPVTNATPPPAAKP